MRSKLPAPPQPAAATNDASASADTPNESLPESLFIRVTIPQRGVWEGQISRGRSPSARHLAPSRTARQAQRSSNSPTGNATEANVREAAIKHAEFRTDERRRNARPRDRDWDVGHYQGADCADCWRASGRPDGRRQTNPRAVR